MISLSVEDGLLDLGDALVGDTISSNFKVRKGSFCTERFRVFSPQTLLLNLYKNMVRNICHTGGYFGAPHVLRLFEILGFLFSSILEVFNDFNRPDHLSDQVKILFLS